MIKIFHRKAIINKEITAINNPNKLGYKKFISIKPNLSKSILKTKKNISPNERTIFRICRMVFFRIEERLSKTEIVKA